MAPSRAMLIRRIASACVQPQIRMRASTRLLSTSATAVRPQCIRATAVPRLQTTNAPSQAYSTEASGAPEPPDFLNEAELHVFNKIKGELEPTKLEVQDISGGCGSMYAIEIESSRFQGLTVIKQHKLVNQVLKEEIAQWHGVQLRTRAA
ncbi:bola-like protein [Didymella exigua CBS 183.55]|uniref:Bola-like protein n=1 Tax=Didymella exigua CBS 183.55 TaxID=1150837 RepID=A0A6A5RJM0_9PLEO|nr:bola-like protein [Didymella exigua CBS 183.55]KAF1927298.1 bola-like protein [Didymella exigua CBS 183.55]